MKTLLDRFKEKYSVLAETGCWIWHGTKNHKGYGYIFHNGHNRRATHISWEIYHKRPFPKGRLACHTCDTPSCVNPLHVWPGTLSDNVNDAISKGRMDPLINLALAHRKAKMFCRKGHKRTAENTKLKGNTRMCLTCYKLRMPMRLQRQRERRKILSEIEMKGGGL